MEFTPISTQEEFDARIKDRLERERSTVRKEFGDYDSIKDSLAAKTKEIETLNGKIDGYVSQISEMQSKLSASETDSVKTRIAYELGLPFELCDRLAGSDEKAIREDAEKLMQIFKATQPTQPLFNPEGAPAKNTAEAAYVELLKNLSNK